jgi:hypothetical protein
MSEYGEIETGQEHGSLEAVHEDQGAEQDYQSQYGILEHDHQSVEHEEFEHLKHVEYTDAAGNHYEVTEYTHYEHTEIEQDHTFAAYGQEGGHAGLSAGTEGYGEAGESGFGQASAVSEGPHMSGLESITARFENFLDSTFLSDNEISDSSA